MDNFLLAFGAHFTATVAIKVIGYTGQKFKKDTSGTQKEKAIERCISTAVIAFYTKAELRSKEESDLLVDIMKKLFSDDDVAREIAALLKGNIIDRDEITYLFEKSGYNPATLPGLDFNSLIETFEAAFVAAAIEEPILQGIIQTEHIIRQSELQQQMIDEMKKLYHFIQSARFDSLKSNDGILQAKNIKSGEAISYKPVFKNKASNNSISLKNADKNIIIQGVNKSIIRIIQNYYGNEIKEQEQEHLQGKVSTYLKWIYEQYRYIDIRGIKREGENAIQLSLEDVYVPLEATFFSKLSDHEKIFSKGIRGKLIREDAEMDTTSKKIGLNQLFETGKRIVITGGPGCGKTTVLLYAAIKFAESLLNNDPLLAKEKLSFNEENLPIPVFIPVSLFASFLREIKPETSPEHRTLAYCISRYLIEKQCISSLPKDFFQKLLESGQSVILLLDGLDEVPNENERAAVRQKIEELIKGRDNLYIVVSCRTAAYKEQTVLATNFHEIKVNPLKPGQVENLITKAYKHIYRHDAKLCSDQTDELVKGIRKLEAEKQARMGEDSEPIVVSPLIVRMLLIVHFNARQLPDQRAELYMRTVDVMLSPEHVPDRQTQNEIASFVGGSLQIHRDLVQYLAFMMHSMGEKKGREIHENELISILKTNPMFSEKIIEDFVTLTKLRETLMEEKDRMYRFIHLTFQEFLAARYLAEIEMSRNGIKGIIDFFKNGNITDPWWREPALLVAGYLFVTSPSTAVIFLEKLIGIDADPNANNDPDIQLASAEVAASACLEWSSLSKDMNKKIAKHIISLFSNPHMMNNSLPLFRTKAGAALARLGDPRKEVTTIDDMQFCLVPKGEFMMGYSEKEESLKLKSDELARKRNIFDDYWLSRYAVTNAQFDFFVKDENGYKNNKWWTKAGKEWRGGKKKPEKYGGVFDLPNHPVVNVTWYEAHAFTRWLTHYYRERGWLDAKHKIRLPTEAEWEKAARGGTYIPKNKIIKTLQDLCRSAAPKKNSLPQRIYPWGDEPDTNKANHRETWIRSTNAVGCFPGGASPYGCEEMSGNVWEWCLTEWVGEYYSEFDKNAEGNGTRVLRGGSWLYIRWNMRCSARYWHFPYFGNSVIGFRLCMASI